MDDQLSLDAMPKKLYSVTPTKLATWDCPRKFRFTYLEKRPKGGPWAHNSVGAAVHAALKQWWDVPLAERDPDAAKELVRRNWIPEGFRDEAQSDQWCDKATGYTREYLKTVDPTVQPIGIERSVAATSHTMAINGRVDRVDEYSGPSGQRELVIVDYKTGRRVSEEDDVRTSPALALYAFASSKTLKTPCTKVSLHHLPSGTIARWQHTEESMHRHLTRADNIAQDEARAQEAWNAGLDTVALRAGETAKGVRADTEVDAVLPPNPTPSCAWCDYRQWCEIGRDAAPPKQRWDALE